MLAGLVRLVTGAQATWKGCEPFDEAGNVPQRIYFANHSSHLDTPVIWAALPVPVRAVTRPAAARDYWDADPIRRFVSQRWLRVVLVERKRMDPAQPPGVEMEEVLAAGESLILFPEGTRNTSPDDGLLPFKAGLFHLARKFPSVGLVPVHLANLSRILPKGEALPVPLLARVVFGAVIRPADDEPKDAFLERARLALIRLADGEES
jgi:1-acyl-sn-glycerol-3-phosphate acyltransferase